MTVCAFEGCGKAAHGHGYCIGHHRQMSEGKHLTALRKWEPRRPYTLLDKIKEYSKPNAETGCWEWQRSIKPNGYAQVTWNGKSYLHAHRAIYIELNGELPSSVYVLHRCDNRICVNPDHLFPGTDLDNIADRNAKMRQARGDQVGTSVLTWPKVREIRSRFAAGGCTYKGMGREYGVSDMTIKNVVVGNSWRE